LYTVETDGSAQHQVDALPAEALAAYAELRVVLETAPWSGRPYHRDNPQGAVRTLALARTDWWCTSFWRTNVG